MAKESIAMVHLLVETCRFGRGRGVGRERGDAQSANPT